MPGIGGLASGELGGIGGAPSTGGGGSGTVTSVSVVSANGFAGTVATPTTTPAITISTSVGSIGTPAILKGNGTSISAAVAGTDYTTPTGTEGLSNKRITRRFLNSVSPGATPALNTDSFDMVMFSSLATNITSMTTGLTGTPVEGDQLILQFLDNGTARTIAWGTSFLTNNIPLPTTTVPNTILTVGFLWNTFGGSYWNCVGVG